MIIYPISKHFSSLKAQMSPSDGRNFAQFVIAYVFGLLHLFTPYYNNFYYGLAIILFILQANYCFNKLGYIFVS